VAGGGGGGFGFGFGAFGLWPLIAFLILKILELWWWMVVVGGGAGAVVVALLPIAVHRRPLTLSIFFNFKF